MTTSTKMTNPITGELMDVVLEHGIYYPRPRKTAPHIERHIVVYGEHCTYWVIRDGTISFNLRGSDVKGDRAQFFTYIMRKLQERGVKAQFRLRGDNIFDIKFKDHGELQLMSKGLLKSTGENHIR